LPLVELGVCLCVLWLQRIWILVRQVEVHSGCFSLSSCSGSTLLYLLDLPDKVNQQPSDQGRGGGGLGFSTIPIMVICLQSCKFLQPCGPIHQSPIPNSLHYTTYLHTALLFMIFPLHIFKVQNPTHSGDVKLILARGWRTGSFPFRLDG
jgi:hypothetical protein